MNRQHPKETRVTQVTRVSLFSVTAALLVVACSPESRPALHSPESPTKVRAVLVTLDTVRADALERETGLKRLRQRVESSGTNFTRCFAATSTTQPTHASLFTGLHPWRHGVLRNGQHLDLQFDTLAEVLQRAGYFTGAVVASYPLKSGFGLEQGFAEYDDTFDLGGIDAEWQRNAEKAGMEVDQPGDRFYSLAEDVVERAIAMLAAHEESRQFLWFHFFDGHAPYGDTRSDGVSMNSIEVLDLAEAGHDPTAALGRARELYDQDVEHLDLHLERLLDRLLESDEGYVNHVFLVGDHGESFGEDGSMAHGTRLTASQIQVPCTVFSPALGKGRREDAVGSIDIAETLLDLLGIDQHLGEGSSLMEGHTDRSVYGMRQLYSGDRPPTRKFRRLDGKSYPPEQPWFYARYGDGSTYIGNQRELEVGPATGADRDRTLELFSRFEREMARLLDHQLELSAEDEEGLRALGYID